MENEHTRTLAAIGSMLVELFARQIAVLGILRSQPGFDESSYREALRQAHEQLDRIPGISTLRSQASGQRLEEIERTLRVILFPNP